MTRTMNQQGFNHEWPSEELGKRIGLTIAYVLMVVLVLLLVGIFTANFGYFGGSQWLSFLLFQVAGVGLCTFAVALYTRGSRSRTMQLGIAAIALPTTGAFVWLMLEGFRGDWYGILFMQAGLSLSAIVAASQMTYVLRSFCETMRSFANAINSTLPQVKRAKTMDIEQARECPKCHSLNEAQAEHCICGYAFFESKGGLTTKWLTFYTYVRTPLSILLMIATKPEMMPQTIGIVFAFYRGVIIIALVALLVGLHRRRLWAWRLNWFMLAEETLTTPFSILLEDSGVSLANQGLQFIYIDYFIGLAIISLMWFLPNLIYFRKRRVLFH